MRDMQWIQGELASLLCMNAWWCCRLWKILAMNLCMANMQVKREPGARTHQVQDVTLVAHRPHWPPHNHRPMQKLHEATQAKREVCTRHMWAKKNIFGSQYSEPSIAICSIYQQQDIDAQH